MIALTDTLDIRIIDTQTGELLRQLTLDTTRSLNPVQGVRTEPFSRTR